MYTSQDRAEGRNAIWFWLLMAALVIVGVLVIRAVLLVPSAAVGVAEKTLDANNIIHKYEWFHDTAGAINARVAQVKAHKQLVAGETDSGEKSRLRIELAGQQQSCRDLVQSYNANAAKANVSLFKTDATPASFNAAICE